MNAPQPDHKDWTWVLTEPCPECGFDASTIERAELGPMIRSNAADWRSLLGRGDLVTERPPSDDGRVIWSALEYGAHVRDVYVTFGDRLTTMLAKKNPTFRDWDQNQAAIDGRYGDEDPSRVAYQLAAAAGKVADIVDRIRGDRWERTGSRSDGRPFTVETLVVYLLHDVSHHVHDVEAGYAAILDARDPDADVDEPGSGEPDGAAFGGGR